MPDPTQLDILAIAAHPDDIEITCGGFMIKMASMGRKTGALDLTAGEMGTYGDQTDRASEAAAAAEIMGLTWRGNLGIPDSAVEFNQANKLKIAQVIRQTQPELVVLPHWEQRHPDHAACSRLGFDACFLAGLKKIDIEGEPFRPRKIVYASYFRNTDHSFMVDISESFETKCKAIAAYHSQFSDEVAAKRIFMPGVDVNEMIRIRAAQLGQQIGVQYAEAFTLKEPIRYDDPQKMPGQSI
jgi:bacillithiol biosynthesis deacetylase BshB1